VKQVKKEVNPAVVGVILAVVAVAVLFMGYRALAVPDKKDTTGSEKDIQRVKNGEPMYTPPAGVVPGYSGGGAAGSPPSGAPGGAAGAYNLKPPPN